MDLSITLIIIIITVAASFYAWNNQTIFQKWILNPYTVHRRKEYHRLITSGFIHNDYMHLLFNMLALYFFGELVEKTYIYAFGNLGIVLYIALYIVGIIASDLPTYLKHKNHAYYNSLGASGGVSAVVFSSILFYPTEKICVYFVFCLSSFIFGGLYILYSYLQAKKGGDYINHDAHLYGAVFGIVFSILIMPSVIISFFEQVSNWRITDLF
jgi:membrane associated rhomboid family serine protease